MDTDMATIDPANIDQARAWDGDAGAFWTANADRFDRTIAGYDEAFFAAAAIRPDDRVLDVGCGTGSTTRMAARQARLGSALGVDLSARMLDEARRRAAAEGMANVVFEQVDAQIHSFDDRAFDVVISRTGVMFFGDPVAAFANLARATSPGGRLVLLTWQPLDRNRWLADVVAAMSAGRQLPSPPSDAPGPFSLSDPVIVRETLQAAGFVDVKCGGLAGSMDYGPNADQAYDFVIGLAGWMLHGLDAAGAARAKSELRAAIAAHEQPDGVLFDSAVWLITAAVDG